MITLTVMQKEELSIFVKIIDATICYAEKVWIRDKEIVSKANPAILRKNPMGSAAAFPVRWARITASLCGITK